uniref:Putative conserved secreted protein n=1 Tax=Ixodes ricinus TaxID=34613 RepID=A0A6B0V5Z6_IXORI
MRLAILAATLFIVGVASKNALVIFDLTECVMDFALKFAKEKHRDLVSCNLSAAGEFSEIVREGRTPFKIKLGNFTYGMSVHSKMSKESTNYTQYFMNPTTEPQPGYYMSNVRAPIAAIWNFDSVFKSEFPLVTSTEPPKVYNGSQERIYKFDFNDTLKLERKGYTYHIRNKTFTVKPGKEVEVTETVRESTKVRPFSVNVTLVGYFGIKLTTRGDEPGSYVFCVTQLPCPHLKKTGAEEMTFEANGTFEEHYPVSAITLTRRDLKKNQEDIQVVSDPDPLSSRGRHL